MNANLKLRASITLEDEEIEQNARESGEKAGNAF